MQLQTSLEAAQAQVSDLYALLVSLHDLAKDSPDCLIYLSEIVQVSFLTVCLKYLLVDIIPPSRNCLLKPACRPSGGCLKNCRSCFSR
jgi:hypothetical protein